ncbi:MAG: hypothetical protein LBK06_03290, partial [Planctomycetaceae bacterium]|nr:hypothetical protein [Planctomycetaceae bacterium]
MNENIKQKILFEISQIDEVIKSTKPLRDLCKIKAPDVVEKSAVALLLQSFYNGVENVLIIIVKYFDEKLPSGNKWHKELLNTAFEESPQKHRPIFRKEIRVILNDYMSM